MSSLGRWGLGQSGPLRSSPGRAGLRHLDLSIRARLALGMAVITVLVVLCVAAVQYLTLSSFLALGERQRLELLIPRIEGQIAGSRTFTSAVLARANLPRSVDVRVIQAGRVVALSGEFPAIGEGLPPGYALRGNHNVLVRRLEVRGTVLTLQLASDVLGVVDPLRAYLNALSVSAPVAAVLVALLSFAHAGRLLRPLARLQAAAAAVGRGASLRTPLPEAGRRDELGQLARVLQTSFGQVADVREREESFTRAAAHDLRSPLSALKTRLQGALAGPRDPGELREEIAEALCDVERMRRLTEHLLTLASGAQGVRLRPLELAGVVGEAVDRARERAPDTPLDFATRGDTTVLGDASLITHLIQNLLDNALRHGGGAAMRVSVTGTPTGATLRVSDSGPGVPTDALPHLTKPFYQLDAARGGEGNGLGLAIVQRVVDAHGASLAFEGGLPGGLDVVVAFPRSGPEAEGAAPD
ncbi:HAMP domain-containing sensor histidine kinase [Deinococcus sp.]|uniref:sensor histidine kinase n=1 Tax=Deinococcus sp. TaxID=47478 RepID=UPI0025D0A475|nr:HAMP domain-containing sensor histidine kinase [Deinococcus sp.]